MSSKLRRPLAAALAALCLVGALSGCKKKEDDKPKLQYASQGVTVLDDPDELQKQVDEAYAAAKNEDGKTTILIKNSAISENGTDFVCYIGNSTKNKYDAFFAIYADAEMTDELYLSGLIRPGEVFKNITLERALDPGTHTVYVAETLVEEDLETIHSQVLFTLDFTVKS